ncbi:MAG: hypothetical protein ACOX56_04180 [Acholeplasmataceae bacterium]|jgi:hypothetical protein
MNKKIVTLLLVIFSMIAVVVISVFGKVPEDTTRIAVESISFIDPAQEDGQCIVNNDGEKVILIPRGTTTYQLQYIINPENPTEPEVTFMIVSGADHAEVDETTGLLTFTHEYIIRVRIYSNPLDYKFDTVLIDFTGGDDTIIDPF